MCRRHYRGFLDYGHPLGKLYADHGDHIAKMRKEIERRFPARPSLPIEFPIGERAFSIADADWDRFLAKVAVGEDGVWIWSAAPGAEGYGTFHVGGNKGPMAQAHRLAYTVLVGPIPEGMDLDHVRHNDAYQRGECVGGKGCLHRREVDPAFLVPRTREENWLHGAVNSSVVALTGKCKWGHPLSGENLRIYRGKDGSERQVCRACKRRAYHESVARKKARGDADA